MSAPDVQLLTVNTTEALRWWQRLAPDGPIPLHRNTLYRHIASAVEVTKNDEGEWRIPVSWLDARYHRAPDCPLPPIDPPAHGVLRDDEADGLAALLLDQQQAFGVQLDRLLDRHDDLSGALRTAEVDRAALDARRAHLQAEIDRLVMVTRSKDSEVDGLRAALERLRCDLEAERVERARVETELTLLQQSPDANEARWDDLMARIDALAEPAPRLGLFRRRRSTP